MYVIHVVETPSHHRFPLGQLAITPNARKSLTVEDTEQALDRHVQGDWGEVDEHDREANNTALAHGTRLLSAYTSASGVKFWIITEADRSATTILLPEDY